MKDVRSITPVGRIPGEVLMLSMIVLCACAQTRHQKRVTKFRVFSDGVVFEGPEAATMDAHDLSRGQGGAGRKEGGTREWMDRASDMVVVLGNPRVRAAVGPGSDEGDGGRQASTAGGCERPWRRRATEVIGHLARCGPLSSEGRMLSQ